MLIPPNRNILFPTVINEDPSLESGDHFIADIFSQYNFIGSLPYEPKNEFTNIYLVSFAFYALISSPFMLPLLSFYIVGAPLPDL